MIHKKYHIDFEQILLIYIFAFPFRYDKEGLGAIRTNVFFKRVGIEGRPVTYTPRSKVSVQVQQRPKSEIAQASMVDLNSLLPQKNGQKKDNSTKRKDCVEPVKNEIVQNGVVNETEAEIKVPQVRLKKKVRPKLENIIDCLHYRVSIMPEWQVSMHPGKISFAVQLIQNIVMEFQS